MKNALLLSTLLTLVACNGHNHTTTTTVENDFDNSANNARFADLEARVASLEASVTLNISQIELNAVTISGLESHLSSDVLSLQEEISTTKAGIVALRSNQDGNSQALTDAQHSLSQLQAQLNQAIASYGSDYATVFQNINTLQNSTASLQGSINTLVGKLAAIDQQESVAGIVDPCPSVASHDYKEQFIRMSSGKLVAFFEDGGKRFLTVLTPGHYRTTDSRACAFSVNANNTILN